METAQIQEKKDRFKVLRIIKNTVLGILIVVLTIVLITSMISKFSGNTPSLFGFSLFRVSSGSMAPELEVGDVILVQGCDGSQVEMNDIVTYVATSGEMSGKLITHRVVKAPYSEGGETYLVTKGDANAISDEPIKADQIEGKMLFKVGVLNYLFDFFVTPWGLLTIIALVILAFFNEIILLFKAIFGIGFEDDHKETVEEIIERYQRENLEKQKSEEAAKADETDDHTSTPEE